MSCRAPDDCIAAGSSPDATANNDDPLLSPFDGSWSSLTPTGVRYGYLDAIGCATNLICVAGGISLVTTLTKS